MISTLLLLAMAPTKFIGGDARDVAKCLFETSGQPVAISVLEKQKYKGFDFDLSDTYGFAKALKGSTELVQSPGVLMAFSERMLPRSFIEVEPVFQASTAATYSSFEVKDSLKDGKITIETPADSSLDRALLGRINFSKPLKMHWTLDQVSIPVFAKELPELAFLQLVAKATGTTFINNRDHFLLDIDPNEFQIRATTTLKKFGTPEALKKLNDSGRWAFEMAQFALSVADKNSMKNAFELPGSSATIVLSNGSKQTLYSNLAKYSREADSLVTLGERRPRGAQLKPTNSNTVGVGGGESMVPAFFSQVNWNQDVAVVLMSNFHTRVLAYSANGGGRNRSRPISLEFGN